MRKPFLGSILGILIGVAVAIVLARQGVWPADQITLFFLPGILGLLGLLLLSMGRPSAGNFSLVASLLILVPILTWGALGFGEINQTGVLNGGCEVTATSDVDTTNVTDTSRGDPFVIDPDGGLIWAATSPTVFEDYDWEIHVVVGGLPLTVDSGTEANDAGDLVNDGDVSDVGAYAEERGIDLALYRGVYEVGGSAASCDGFGFVKILGDGFDTVALIALITAVTLFVILLVLTFVGRGSATAVAAASDASGAGEPGAGTGATTETPDGDVQKPGPAADIAAGAAAAGYGRDMFDEDGNLNKQNLSREDLREINEAGETQDLDQAAPPSPEKPRSSSDTGKHETPPKLDRDSEDLPGLDD